MKLFTNSFLILANNHVYGCESVGTTTFCGQLPERAIKKHIEKGNLEVFKVEEGITYIRIPKVVESE